MENIGTISYSAGGLFFFVLTLVLVTGWRGRLQGALLVAAAAATTLWAAGLAWHGTSGTAPDAVSEVLENLRYLAWYAFLLGILRQAGTRTRAGAGQLRAGAGGLYTVLGLLTVLAVLPAQSLRPALITTITLGGDLLLAIGGLWLVELLFRNTRPEHRWAIKYLCLGLGLMFAYDFYLYSDALLFRRIDLQLWNARGAVDALVVPLIAVSAARNPQWSLDVFVSRGVVYHGATLVGTGGYLLVMAAAGYYIRVFGGEWGPLLHTVFLFGAGAVLLALLFSGQARARVKVFLNKHFFNYRYDYREEWLRFTKTLSACKATAQPRECVIGAIAAIVESPAGILWTRRPSGSMAPVAGWNAAVPEGAVEPTDGPFVRFLDERGWVLHLDEYRSNPELYRGLALPTWLTELPRAWVVVPLIDRNELFGFVVLTRPRANIAFNWEVRDLLKTAGCQAASHLAQFDTLQSLAEARQFEGFNRLSALILHDLKNLIAQQSLVVDSAARHKHNPAFIDDAVRIMSHSVDKMNRLMALLRKGLADATKAPIDLAALTTDAVTNRARSTPVPALEGADTTMPVLANRDRLLSAVENLIQNAQEATGKDGHVRVVLTREGGRAVLLVEDDGCGMDTAFVRERLFRPFDSTKGDTGMGIGAYETREYIHELGGDLTVTSTSGRGTRFRIELPRLAGVPAETPHADAVQEGLQ